MKHLIKSAADHPLPVLVFLAVFTALAAWQIPKLEVQISAETMLEKQTPAWEYFIATEAIFGSEDVTVIVIEDPDIFEQENIQAVREMLKSLEALPFVSRTASLFNTPNLKNIDGFIHTRPYLDVPPGTIEQVARLKADATRNPLVLGNLISDDGQTMAINVFLRHESDDPNYDRAATAAIEHLIAPLRARLDDVFQIGASAMRSDLTERIRSDQRAFLPLSVLVLLLTLAFTLRRATAALIPLCTAGLSVIWVLGFLGATGIPINIMTSIVPALVIIIGSTEDIHLLAEYSAGIEEGMTQRGAMDRMADKMGLAILLTFVTTYLGFLSIALNDIELLFQFGLAASTGLLFNFAITVLLAPILLRKFGHRRRLPGARRAGRARYQRLAAGLVSRLQAHHRAIYWGAGILGVAALLAATQLRINNNFLDYLGEHSALRAHAERLHDELSGVHTFSVVIDSGIDNTFLQVKYLEEVQHIQALIEEAGVFDRSFSFADFVALLNSVMATDDQGTTALPDTDDIVREYMLFISQEDVASYVSADFDRARILVRHNIESSAVLNDAVEGLQKRIAAEIDPALRVEITGKSVLSNRAVQEMARGQLQSLLLVSIVIVVLVSVLFVSLRAGLIALIPNLFPVLILFGVMAVAGIPLNAGTSMIAAIALGICVDDTMHVMSRFHEELKAHDNRSAALVAMLQAEAVPIVATSTALSAGFLVFAVSSFQPVVYFGVLSAMVIVVALVATFVLTPLLLGTAELLTVWDLLSCKIQNDTLRGSPLFSGMRIWQIKKLLLASEIRRFPAASRIVREGTEGREMFVILEGSVEACKTHNDGRVDRLRIMGAGELFGEVAPLSGCRRTADVFAIEDTSALVLSWKRIDRLTHLYPVLAFRLFRNLTRIIGGRLTETREYTIGEDAAAAMPPETASPVPPAGPRGT